MSFSSVIALTAIVAAFLLFAVALAWAEYQTRHLPKNEITDEKPTPREKGRIRPAAERKTPASVNS